MSRIYLNYPVFPFNKNKNLPISSPNITNLVPNKLPHRKYERKYKTHTMGKQYTLPTDKNYQECNGPILH